MNILLKLLIKYKHPDSAFKESHPRVILDQAWMWAVVVLLSQTHTHSLSGLMRSATHCVFLLWANGAWNRAMWFWHRIAASW